jgi:4-amino-4-deoxy-L-arabinose transferase-like glycosyltransferase
MTVLEELMKYSQFTLIVMVAMLALVGLPQKRSRYRILIAAFAVLCFAAALQWYAAYVVGLHYLKAEAHWPSLVASVLFVLATGVFLSELIALRLFRRYAKDEKEPNQTPEPTAPSGRGSP